jgi:hypothetical protein
MVATWSLTGMLALVLTGALALSGCGGGGQTSAASSSSSSTPAISSAESPTTVTIVTTTTVKPEDEVKAAYLAYWTMVERLLQTPDSNDPELPTRAVDPVLSFLSDDLADFVAEGHHVVFRAGGRYVHRFLSASVAGSLATVTGCQLDDSITETLAGDVIDDSISTSQIRATFVRDAGVWKASVVSLDSEVKGLVGCDA